MSDENGSAKAKHFTDEKGRKWQIEVTGYEFIKIKERLDVNLTEVFKDDFELLVTLSTDMALLGAVLWQCCQSQAEKAGISEDDFFRGLAGDAYSDAAEAFFYALVNFFPKPQQRTVLKMVIDRSYQATDQVLGRMDQELTAIDRRMEQALESIVNEFMLTSSDSVPSQDSTLSKSPIDTPSGGQNT